MLFLVFLSVKINIILLTNLSQLILLLLQLRLLLIHLAKQRFHTFQLILLSPELVLGDRHLGLQLINLVHRLWRTSL